MFKNDSDFIPRTYSVKSYRRQKGYSLKSFVVFMALMLVISIAGVITFLTLYQMV
ncbi:MAG: hypothetical protein N2489_11860 [Clostridia bacterium]|nr:hypothetical protein [Clostridia bacterium]